MTIANTTIRIKKSLTSGNTPSSLANGEIAINQVDGKLYYSTPVGSIQYITNQQTFATINANNSLILAGTSTDTLSFVAGNGITIQANTTSKTITINATENQNYLANSVIFANTSGYLSNTVNIQFFSSNNTLLLLGNVIANAHYSNTYYYANGTPIIVLSDSITSTSENIATSNAVYTAVSTALALAIALG